MPNLLAALFGGLGRKSDDESQKVDRQLALGDNPAGSDGDVIDAADYSAKSSVSGPGVDLGNSISFEVNVSRGGDQWISFTPARIELLGGEGFRFNDRQSYWIKQLSIPYARKPLQTPQVLFETVRLYADLAITLDNHLRSGGGSLDKLWANLRQRSGYYDNIFYTLECIAECYVGLHYEGRTTASWVDFSFDLLRDRTDQAAVEAIRGVVASRLEQLPPASDETIERFGLNQHGSKPFWWDESGVLRTRDELSGRWLHMLYSLGNRGKVKFLADEEMKFATVMIYFATVKSLLEAEIDGQPKPELLADMSTRLDWADESSHPALNVYSEYDTEILTAVFKMVEAGVRYSYRASAGIKTISVEKSLRQILGEPWLVLIHDSIKQHKAAQLPKLPWSNSWKPGLRAIEETIGRDNLKEKLAEAKQLVGRWTEPELLADIYYNLAEVFAPHHPVAASYYYYKHGTTRCFAGGRPRPKKLSEATRLKIFGSKQRWQSFESLLGRNMVEDQSIWQAIKGIFPQPGRRIELDSDRQSEIQQLHSQTVAYLHEFVGGDMDDGLVEVDSRDQDQAVESLGDIFGDSGPSQQQIDGQQLDLLRLFLDNNGCLEQGQLADFARLSGVLPGSLVTQLNRTLSDVYGVDPVTQLNQQYHLEDSTINLAKEIIHSHAAD